MLQEEHQHGLAGESLDVLVGFDPGLQRGSNPLELLQVLRRDQFLELAEVGAVPLPRIGAATPQHVVEGRGSARTANFRDRRWIVDEQVPSFPGCSRTFVRIGYVLALAVEQREGALHLILDRDDRLEYRPLRKLNQPSEDQMKLTSKLLLTVIPAALISVGCSSQPSNLQTQTGDTRPQPVVIQVPIEILSPGLESGCWVQFYSDRNFKGDVATPVGPASLESAHKMTGKQLEKHIDGLVNGSKATLRVYEYSMFKGRSAVFRAKQPSGGLDYPAWDRRRHPIVAAGM